MDGGRGDLGDLPVSVLAPTALGVAAVGGGLTLLLIAVCARRVPCLPPLWDKEEEEKGNAVSVDPWPDGWTNKGCTTPVYDKHLQEDEEAVRKKPKFSHAVLYDVEDYPMVAFILLTMLHSFTLRLLATEND